MQKPDEELYRLMKQGESAAFAELYDRREPGLYRYALHMTGSVAAAQEIAHDVFVQLMSAGNRFDAGRGRLDVRRRAEPGARFPAQRPCGSACGSGLP